MSNGLGTNVADLNEIYILFQALVLMRRTVWGKFGEVEYPLRIVQYLLFCILLLLLLSDVKISCSGYETFGICILFVSEL
jgi:hypothetical protein